METDDRLEDFTSSVTTVDADEVDADTFDPRTPLVIRGALRRARRKWTDAWLRDRFGDGEVQVSLDSRTAQPEFATEVRWSDFAEQMGERGEDEPGYLFHSVPGSEGAEDLLDDLDIPQVILDLGEPSMHRFFAGPARSGTLPHFHTHAINALTRGRKRWAIYFGINPRVTRALVQESLRGFGSGSQAASWFETQCEVLRQRPRVRLWEFEQEAGDLVFIPGGFIHAVVNLEPVLGFTVEFEVERQEWTRPDTEDEGSWAGGGRQPAGPGRRRPPGPGPWVGPRGPAPWAGPPGPPGRRMADSR
jgi:hypothetical protein